MNCVENLPPEPWWYPRAWAPGAHVAQNSWAVVWALVVHPVDGIVCNKCSWVVQLLLCGQFMYVDASLDEVDVVVGHLVLRESDARCGCWQRGER